MKEITQEKTPACQIPYRNVNQPFRLQFVIPGPGIEIWADENGICYISTKGGFSLEDLVAGDNIEINRTDDGKLVISSVNTATNIAAGQNITIDIDPDTGTAIINSIIGGPTNEHYKGVFDSPEDLIAADPEPEVGDYGMIKNIVITNGEASWNGQYKYCFYINGKWTVVDQMLTFTKNMELLQQFYSVGGSSPVIYLHEIARSGDFWALNNIPIVATPVVTVEGNTVTASCETEGADIWYTDDGTMPHVNGTKYTGPITASGATTFRFVGIKNGMINSLEAVVGADFSLEPPVVEYDYHTAEVTLTNPNVDGNDDPVGDIYYTIDGTEPTSGSTLYTGPFDVKTMLESETRTVKAVVYDSGSDVYSEIVSAFYNKAKTNGSYGSNAEIGRITQYWTYPENHNTIVPAADGETYYTLDGSTPNYNSTPFTETLYFNRYGGPVTLKVIGYRPAWLPTNVRTMTLGYDKPTAPTISFDGETNTVTLGATGNVTANPSIPLRTTMENPNNGYRIYYTLDGSTPTDQSTLYTGPFQISGNVTVKALIVAYGQYYSDVSHQAIVITTGPVITLDSDTGDITITGPAGSSIYYTLNGTTPTTESTVYTQPFNVENQRSVTVKAIAVVGGQESAVSEATFPGLLLKWSGSASVDIDYSIGRITSRPRNPESGASVFYDITASGYPSAWKPYTGTPVFIDLFDSENPREFLYRQTKPGWIPAWYGGNRYGYKTPDAPVITVDDVTELVTMAIDGNTAEIPLQTNNNVPDMGARIWYTLDGSTPDSSTGTLYTGPFTLPEGVTTIKAITECYGEYDSDVTTENIGQTTDYLYFEAAEANSSVSLVSPLVTAPNLEYSTDGEAWQEWQHTTADGLHTFDTLTLSAIGDRVYLRGNNPNGFCDVENTLFSNILMTGQIKAGGSITSIIDGDGVSLTEIPTGGFGPLLAGSLGSDPNPCLITAPSFGNVTTIGEYGCYYLFGFCTNLISGPNMSLISIIKAGGCIGMFGGCSSLHTVSDMESLTSAEVGCCQVMYTDAGINSAANMPSLETIGYEAFNGMYGGCTFNMSDDGTTLNFDFPTPPVTAGETTYATAYDIAEWMGNTNGFTNP